MCVSPAEVKKKYRSPEKDVSGFEKRSGVRARFFGAEEKTALFLGLIAGLKKSWRSKKRHAAAENKMDQSCGLEKDISGSKKRAAPNLATEFSTHARGQATDFDEHPAASRSAMPCPGARPPLADRAPSMPEIAPFIVPT